MENQIECKSLNEFFRKFVILARFAGPNKPVLKIIRKDREESLTFQELTVRAQEFAAYLITQKNVKIRDKIAILGKNRIDWDIAFWGTVLAGAIPVLIDPERRVEGVKKHLLQTDAKILVIADDYQDNESRGELKRFASAHNISLVEMTIYPSPDTKTFFNELEQLVKIKDEIKSDDTAVILCTSGTTGDPREVELTHRNLISNLQGALEIVKMGSKDKLCHILPPHHSFGLTIGKLLPLYVGATNVYTNKFHQISEIIKKEEVTIFVAVPALFTLLAKRIEEEISKLKEKSYFVRLLDRFFPKLLGRAIAKKQGWQKLRFFVSGAAAMPKWVLEVFWKRGLELREGYGTTENSPVYGFNTNPKKLGSVGKPIPTLSVKIVNEQGQTLQAGERGEIMLGGPCIAKGYYKNPKATLEIFETDKEGVRWLHTGDLGYLDEDGCLYITGRKKYIIVLSGGKNVNPELVELVFSQTKYVKEILIVPHLLKGPAGFEEETIGAIVVPNWEEIKRDTPNFLRDYYKRNPGVLKDLIWQSIQDCQQKSKELSSFEKIPSKELLQIRFDEFEKTPTGKIKRELYLQ